MGPAELLKWQWNGYPRYHRSRTNLLLHIVVVPLFLTGNVALVVGLVGGSFLEAGLAAMAMVTSAALQGVGHRREPVPPEPFTSRWNAVARLFLEQWINFPRFVLSGKWLRALRQSNGQAR
jgi:hypothetical protein